MDPFSIGKKSILFAGNVDTNYLAGDRMCRWHWNKLSPKNKMKITNISKYFMYFKNIIHNTRLHSDSSQKYVPLMKHKVYLETVSWMIWKKSSTHTVITLVPGSFFTKPLLITDTDSFSDMLLGFPLKFLRGIHERLRARFLYWCANNGSLNIYIFIDINNIKILEIDICPNPCVMGFR